MDWPSLILLAFALCFDSVAVSAVVGMCCNKIDKNNSYIPRLIRFCMVLAIMQGLMPFIGWLAASNFRHIIERWDHWIAFGLLLVIGGKMILDYFNNEEEESENLYFNEYTSLKNSLLLGLATSIDALIVGVSMAMLDIDLLTDQAGQFANMSLAVAIIALVTFLCAIMGAILGKCGSRGLSQKSSIIGGVILILIGVKILLEHLNIM